MYNHTLILKTERIKIPEGITIAFVVDLVNTASFNLEYFGIEINNQADYIDNEMMLASEKISNFEFYFDTLEVIDYDTFSKIEVQELIVSLVENAQDIDFRSDGKDITVYL